MESTCGYITFVNTGVIDIGCEDHDPNVRLGKNIANNIDKISGIVYDNIHVNFYQGFYSRNII